MARKTVEQLWRKFAEAGFEKTVFTTLVTGKLSEAGLKNSQERLVPDVQAKSQKRVHPAANEPLVEPRE
jgi:hypothetical protein